VTPEAWGKFMGFAAKFVKSVDLDGEEYGYKLALAARLKTTRELYLSGQSDWFERLRRDISSSNLMNQYFMMRLVDLGRTRPEELRTAVDILWTGDPEVARIDRFTEQLRPYNPEQFSLGGVVGFASILLLGRDPQVSRRTAPAPSRNSSSSSVGKTGAPTEPRPSATSSCSMLSTKCFGWLPSTALNFETGSMRRASCGPL
jgi:hypothetical protein